MSEPEIIRPKNMAEIAQLLGVSAVSVSLALRNSPTVSQELRDQVQEIVDRTGFKVRSYRKRRSAKSSLNTLAGKVVVLYEAANTEDPVAQQIMNSVIRHLSARKIQFETCSCEDLYNDNSMIDGARGIIYHYCFRPWFSTILKGIPQIAIMHEENDLGICDGYKPNNTMAGKLAADYLLGQQFNRLILTWEHKMAYHPHSHPRLEGFRHRAKENGAALLELAYGRNDEPMTYQNQLRSAIEQFGGRAGIFAFNDQVAFRVCTALDCAGLLREPKKLEVVSCDNTFLLKNITPPLPVIDLHINEIAERAVDGMIWRWENPHACHQDILLKPDLITPDGT